MSKLSVPLPLTSVILGCNLLILPLVLAQANPANTPVPEIQTTANLPEKNQATSLQGLTATSIETVTSTDEIDIINQFRTPSSVTTFNSNDFGEESLSNSSIVPITSENQVSSSNGFPSVTKEEPQIQEIPANLQQNKLYSQPPDIEDEVTSVEDLRDVSPGDWAYEALRNLVEKYRCIAGSFSGTFDGNRAITRYEFAAAFDSCLLKIRRSIYSLNNKLSSQEDLAVLQRLQAEFATEIKTIISCPVKDLSWLSAAKAGGTLAGGKMIFRFLHRCTQ